MGRTVYKVERKTSTGNWYEVMLSPFLRVRDAGKYIDKYSNCYPTGDNDYRVIDATVDSSHFKRLKSFFKHNPQYTNEV
jgi:hypothetical protein